VCHHPKLLPHQPAPAETTLKRLNDSANIYSEIPPRREEPEGKLTLASYIFIASWRKQLQRRAHIWWANNSLNLLALS
jgi:hypothetical protein